MDNELDNTGIAPTEPSKDVSGVTIAEIKTIGETHPDGNRAHRRGQSTEPTVNTETHSNDLAGKHSQGEPSKTVSMAEVEANKAIGWFVDTDGMVKQVVTISPREVRIIGPLMPAQPTIRNDETNNNSVIGASPTEKPKVIPWPGYELPIVPDEMVLPPYDPTKSRLSRWQPGWICGKHHTSHVQDCGYASFTPPTEKPKTTIETDGSPEADAFLAEAMQPKARDEPVPPKPGEPSWDAWSDIRIALVDAQEHIQWSRKQRINNDDWLDQRAAELLAELHPTPEESNGTPEA